MKQQTYTFWLTGGISICLAAINPTQAQPVPDATLPVNSTVKFENNISTISGGTVAGRNLFHSFKQFNIGEEQIADFVSPSAAIQNILARVTGSSISEIMGTLKTSGLSNPNLFLINPNGIVFGPNASLKVNGSFVATTANAIQFGNQGFFSASAPNAPGLLTVNPSAFLFNQIGTRSIENNSIAPAGFEQSGWGLIGLRVPDNRSLLLVGGNVTLNNGQLHALGGRVDLGGVAGAGTVGLNVEDNNLRLSYPEVGQRADVSLTNDSQVNVTAGVGGSIAINARNLDVLGGSSLQAGIGSDLKSDGTQAGDIALNATGVITISEYSEIANDVGFGAVGNAGSILIKAGTLSLTDGAVLSASTFGEGEVGGISVQADKSVSIASSFITTGPYEETGVGNGGDINIQTGDLSLTDGTRLDTITSGEGRAGDVFIDARNTVFLENSFISSETFGPGNAGIINIKARALSLTEGAELLSRTSGQGNAGNIQVNASDSVSISGVNLEEGFSSGLITETLEDSGQGGDISVTTSALRVLDGAVLSARTRNASPGGNITVDVNTLEVINGGQLLTTAFKSGRAGNITVNASDSVTLSGSDRTYRDRLEQFEPDSVDPDSPASGLSAQATENGNAGGLTINTRALRVQDGAQVTVSSRQGQAGNLTVTANSIFLDQGKLTAETGASEGNEGGANITLQESDLLLMRNESLISARAFNTANGGNITIDTDSIVAIPSEDSDIIANAFLGNGGRVDITASGIFGLQYRDRLTTESDITTSSEFGVQGEVEINTLNVDPAQGLVNLPAELVDASGLIAQGCPGGGGTVGRGASEFIITGRNGLPPNPSKPLSSDTVWSDLRPLTQQAKTPPSSEEATNPTSSYPVPIVEATGWVINNKGEVVLTATAPTATPHSPSMSPPTCHRPELSL